MFRRLLLASAALACLGTAAHAQTVNNGVRLGNNNQWTGYDAFKTGTGSSDNNQANGGTSCTGTPTADGIPGLSGGGTVGAASQTGLAISAGNILGVHGGETVFFMNDAYTQSLCGKAALINVARMDPGYSIAHGDDGRIGQFRGQQVTSTGLFITIGKVAFVSDNATDLAFTGTTHASSVTIDNLSINTSMLSVGQFIYGVGIDNHDKAKIVTISAGGPGVGSITVGEQPTVIGVGVPVYAGQDSSHIDFSADDSGIGYSFLLGGHNATVGGPALVVPNGIGLYTHNGSVQITDPTTGALVLPAYGNGTCGTPSLKVGGGTSGGLYAAANGNLSFAAQGACIASMDNAGRFIVSPFTTSADLNDLFSVANNGATVGIGTIRYNAGGGGATTELVHTRSTAQGVHATLQNNDTLGSINYAGDDGTTFNVLGAQFKCAVSGTVATGVLPSLCTFGAAAPSTGTLTTVYTFNSLGIEIGGGTPVAGLSLAQAFPLTIWNTTDQTTNTQSVTMGFASTTAGAQFNIMCGIAGTGTAGNCNFGSGSNAILMRPGSSTSGEAALTVGGTSATNNIGFRLIGGTMTQSSGFNYFAALEGTVNQTSTASYALLHGTITETGTGSGAHYLLDFGTGASADLFTVLDTGAIFGAGNIRTNGVFDVNGTDGSTASGATSCVIKAVVGGIVTSVTCT